MNILCGDIGGTKTRLAIYDLASFPKPISELSYPSKEYNTFSALTQEFLSRHAGALACAAFGVAGPVQGRSCKTTNLPWHIDADRLEQELAIPSVHLINDLEATAYGIAALHKDDFHTLQQGAADAHGNRAVVAAGTGLGQAGMFWDGARHIPFPTEGGHCDFAPSNDLEYGLLTSLKQDEHNVCWEDILSGPGLVSIYNYLLTQQQESPHEDQDDKQTPEGITLYADIYQDQICIEALELFAKLYGAEAGNLALKTMATGGIYLGGGIAPKILHWLKQPQFLTAFCRKGKMQDLMRSIPIHVILNDRAALYGPAVYLREMVIPKD
jgi:glucokinase